MKICFKFFLRLAREGNWVESIDFQRQPRCCSVFAPHCFQRNQFVLTRAPLARLLPKNYPTRSSFRNRILQLPHNTLDSHVDLSSNRSAR
jgi:hypothetical protein